MTKRLAFRLLPIAALLFCAQPTLGASSTADFAVKYAEGLVAATENAKGVWSVQPDGSIKHVQSGLVCPVTFPNVLLAKLFVFPAVGGQTGTDVGCDYIRGTGSDWGRNLDAVLTIYATQAPGFTLDVAFTQYEAEMHQGMFKNAEFSGARSMAAKPDAATPLPGNKIEMGLLELSGRPYRTELTVAEMNDWIVEVRSTFPFEENAPSYADDREASIAGLMQAAATIGK